MERTMNVGWLTSYWHVRTDPVDWQKTVELTRQGVSVVVDSGAFTAKSLGTPISLLAYHRWLQPRLRAVNGWAASLDVIGDHSATMANYRAMASAGCAGIVPTVHFGAPAHYVDIYADLGAQRIAVGGIAGMMVRGRPCLDDSPAGQLTRWLDAVHARLEARGIKSHGFGVNAPQWARNYSWDSVDGTSFASGARYRNLPIYRNGKMTWRQLRDVTDEEATYLASIGGDVGRMNDAFVTVRGQGQRQWRTLIELGMVAVVQSLLDQAPHIRTLYVSEWSMTDLVRSIICDWSANGYPWLRLRG